MKLLDKIVLIYNFRNPLIGVARERKKKKKEKSEWWMPRLKEAMKDVVSCEKLREGANDL